jgi:hypothetical protein
MAHSHLIVSSALALTISSCAHQSAAPAASMWQHYQRVGEIHSAVVQGNLEEARAAAGWFIGRESPPDLPPGSERLASQMRTYARNIVDANSMEDVATATASMGRTCGQCHATYGRGPALRTGSVEDLGDDMAEMTRHKWASDRMWDGLIGPSDLSWATGAREWSSSSMLPREVREQNDVGGELHGLEAHLHRLGQQAAAEETLQGRAAIYGEMMAACASCHTQIRARG